MIAPAFLDELRAKVPVSTVVGRRVQLRGVGREWRGLSPFNKERTASFFVNDQKGFYHDFSSGKHGDIFAFVMETEGLDFRQAVKRIAALAGSPLPRDRNIAVAPPSKAARAATAEPEHKHEVAVQLQKARQLWQRSLPAGSTIVETYLHARGYHGPIPATLRYLPASGIYPPALIAAYGIATEPEPCALAITDDAVVGVHLIKLKPDGNDRLRDDPKCKITIGKDIAVPIVLAPSNDGLALDIAEGIEDALNAHQATGHGSWAAGGATRLPGLADFIPGYIESVTILVDDNEAGRRNSNELARRAHARGFEVLMTPIGEPS